MSVHWQAGGTWEVSPILSLTSLRVPFRLLSLWCPCFSALCLQPLPAFLSGKCSSHDSYLYEHCLISRESLLLPEPRFHLPSSSCWRSPLRASPCILLQNLQNSLGTLWLPEMTRVRAELWKWTDSGSSGSLTYRLTTSFCACFPHLRHGGGRSAPVSGSW